MKFRLAVCSAILLLPCSSLWAQPASGRPGAFLRMGVGARALALGGTFVALADDPSAAYWNPAGLAQLNHVEVAASYFRMPSDRTHYYAAGILPVGRLNSLGVSWINLGVANLEARSGNTATPDYVFSNSAGALLLSAARQITSFLSVGVNAKLLAQSLDQASAFGFGFDAALFLYPRRNLKLGLAVQDVNSHFKWSTGRREAFPLIVRGGVGVQLADNFLMALDAVKIDGAMLDFSAGAEYKALEVFPIRLGYSTQGMVGGLGMALPMRALDFKLDYAYSDDLLEASRSNKISFGLALSQRKRARKAEDGVLPLAVEAKGEAPRRKPALGKRSKANDLEVLVRAVKVAEGPGTAYQKVGVIKKGERYRKLAAAPNWYQIELADGKTGWVKRKYVKEVKN